LSFSAIIGHERPIAVLKRALENGTLAHAYLFSGDSGVGKKLTAFALAAAVNCTGSSPAEGCGECPSCRKAAGQGHPDLHLIAAEGDEIKIDQIRQIQADLALKPFEGKKKILIIDGAESMNAASANAFLKTLEEPPGEALIVLIASMPQSLLPTIRSRCQEIKFLPLSRPALAGALMERRGISESDAWFLAALAQGSMGRAMGMDIEAEKASREELSRLLSGLSALTPVQVLAQTEAVSKDRERFERLLDIGVEWLRDAIVLHETGNEKLLVYGPAGDMQREWSERISLPRLIADIELFIESRGLLDRRVSPQLVAENLLFKLGRT
jgi:DNA polymerase-3 subunit delta'